MSWYQYSWGAGPFYFSSPWLVGGYGNLAGNWADVHGYPMCVSAINHDNGTEVGDPACLPPTWGNGPEQQLLKSYCGCIARTAVVRNLGYGINGPGYVNWALDAF